MTPVLAVLIGALVGFGLVTWASRRYALVPRRGGTPADLPAWARDELVRRRVESVEFASERARQPFRRGYRIGWKTAVGIVRLTDDELAERVEATMEAMER